MRPLAYLLALTLAAPAWAASVAATGLPDSYYVAPQQMVKIDGSRRLNLICLGQGKPAVILDSGAGGGSMFWRHVQGSIAEITKVCTYDRAGYGFSDPATRPSDAANTVDDLHRLIHAAGLQVPVVYVGHSIAGLYGVLYTAKYPAEIAGAVLVDPSFAHQEAQMMAALTPARRPAVETAMAKGLADMKECLVLAQAGSLAEPKTKAAKLCMDTSSLPDKFSPALLRESAREWSAPPSNAAALSEMSNAHGSNDTDSAELDAAPANFGDKPLIILTHGKVSPLQPGAAPGEGKTEDAVWTAGHDRLAKLSTRGSNRMVAGSGHYIQIDQPGAVVDAVREVVTEVRKAR